MIEPGEVFHFDSFTQHGSGAEATWMIPASCPYLNGHFPNLPVLPAVGLLDASLELLRLAGHPTPARTLALRKAKFTGMVAPGMEVRLILAHKENRLEVEWQNSETRESLATFWFPA